MQNIKSKKDCILSLKKIQEKMPEGKLVSRDIFRKESDIPSKDWEYHFGTFSEFRRQALNLPTVADKKVNAAIAKIEQASDRAELGKERLEYADSYTRENNQRYKTMLVGSDFHDKEIDPFFLRVFLDTAKRVGPDNIVLGGDIFDLPEFGRYTVDPREWDAVGRIKFAHENIFKPLRNNAPDSQIDLIEGNHECVSEDTELLTVQGWIKAKDYLRLEVKHSIASFDLAEQRVTYDAPVAVAEQSGRKIVQLEGVYKKEKITTNHSLIYKGKKTKLEDISGKLVARDFMCALNPKPTAEDLDIDVNLVKFAMWLVLKGTINRTEGDDKYWIHFNAIPARLIRRLKGIVQKIKGVKWISVKNGLEVEGKNLANLLDFIFGQNDIAHGTRFFKLPEWFDDLGPQYGKVIAEELVCATKQSILPAQITYFKGWQQSLGENLQWFLVTRGIPCRLKMFSQNGYGLIFAETGVVDYWRGNKLKVSEVTSNGSVVSIQTKNGTLITRLDGRINFTGNCRLVKHLADFSPATRAILGDLHGMTIADLFGLKKFEINYVAKADLRSYTAREHARELENNYRIYHNNILVHHFPHARNMGLPGVNGHHHKHQVWPMFNIHQGAYEWHQLGAGHKRSASYCEGENWHNGFALIHVDTLTKSVNIEYIPVTNMAVVGGRFYYREPGEFIT